MLKALGSAGRMAGDIFKRGFQSSPKAKVNFGDVVGRLSMDAVFGGMTALNTPGSAVDKAIAGTATTLGGGLGGAVLSGLLPGNTRFNPHVRMITEMAGGIGGDMLGMATGDAILRMKSPDGMSERDRQYKQQDDLYRQGIEQELLQKYNIG
jgi:hypothetical protein